MSNNKCCHNKPKYFTVWIIGLLGLLPHFLKDQLLKNILRLNKCDPRF